MFLQLVGTNNILSRFLFLLYIIPPFSKFTRPFCKFFLYFFQLFSSSKSEITKPIFKQFKCCFQTKSNDHAAYTTAGQQCYRSTGEIPQLVHYSIVLNEHGITPYLFTSNHIFLALIIQVCDSHRWTEWPPYVLIRLSYLYRTALGNFPNEILQAFIAQVAKLATWQLIRQLANLASWNVYSPIISLTQLDRLTGWNQIVDVGKFPTWIYCDWIDHFWVKEIYFLLRIMK